MAEASTGETLGASGGGAQSAAPYAISMSDIVAAAARIKGYVHKTPVLQSASVSDMVGCDLFFKVRYGGAADDLTRRGRQGKG